MSQTRFQEIRQKLDQKVSELLDARLGIISSSKSQFNIRVI